MNIVFVSLYFGEQPQQANQNLVHLEFLSLIPPADSKTYVTRSFTLDTQKGDKFHSEIDTACHNVASNCDIALAVFRHLATFCQSPLESTFASPFVLDMKGGIWQWHKGCS